MWIDSDLTLDISAGSPRRRIMCFPRRISVFKKGKQTLGFQISGKFCRQALYGVVDNHLLRGWRPFRGTHMEKHRALRLGIQHTVRYVAQVRDQYSKLGQECEKSMITEHKPR